MAQNTETTVYVIELRDRFTMGMNTMNAATDRFNRATSQTRKNVDNLSQGFDKFKSAILGAAAAIGVSRFANELYKLNGLFQETRTAFNVMLGDKGLGGEMMDWAKEFARITPITFEQTITSIRKLMAYGMGGSNAQAMTNVLSTIAAGVGKDRLPYLTLALGQVQSMGRLMGTEVRQFREHGVDIIGEIAKGLKIGTDEVTKRVTEGTITFTMVADALSRMTQEGGRFYGMLDELAKTLPGKVDILSATFWQMMQEAFEPMFVGIADGVQWAIDYMNELQTYDWASLGEIWSNSLDKWKELDLDGSMLGMTRFMLRWANYWVTLSDIAGTVVSNLFNAIGGLLDLLKGYVSKFTGGDKADYEWDIASGWAKLRKIELTPKGLFERALERDKAAREFGYNLAPTKDFIIPDFDPSQTKNTATGGDADAAKKKTNRTVGTGARDIIINIGNLMNVEEQTFMTKNLGTDVEQIRTQLTRALLTVVNDTTQMIR